MPSGGGKARPLTDAVADTAEDLDPSYSPDGTGIVFRGERRGRTGLWLLERGSERPGSSPSWITPTDSMGAPRGHGTEAPSSSSATRATDSSRPSWHSRAAVLDLATGTVKELQVAIGSDEVRDVAWAPGERRLALAARSPGTRDGSRLWLADLGKRTATPLTSDSIEARAPAFAPDGRRLAFFARDSADRIQVWVMAVDSAAPAARGSPATPT